METMLLIQKVWLLMHQWREKTANLIRAKKYKENTVHPQSPWFQLRIPFIWLRLPQGVKRLTIEGW